MQRYFPLPSTPPGGGGGEESPLLAWQYMLLLIFILILGDVTFTDVFRDFSNMASTNPDILRRDFGASSNKGAKDPDRQTSL
jgi:hypothetical protein